MKIGIRELKGMGLTLIVPVLDLLIHTENMEGEPLFLSFIAENRTMLRFLFIAFMTAVLYLFYYRIMTRLDALDEKGELMQKENVRAVKRLADMNTTSLNEHAKVINDISNKIGSKYKIEKAVWEVEIDKLLKEKDEDFNERMEKLNKKIKG